MFLCVYSSVFPFPASTCGFYIAPSFLLLMLAMLAMRAGPKVMLPQGAIEAALSSLLLMPPAYEAPRGAGH